MDHPIPKILSGLPFGVERVGSSALCFAPIIRRAAWVLLVLRAHTLCHTLASNPDTSGGLGLLQRAQRSRKGRPMKRKAALTFELAELKAESYIRQKEKLNWLLEKATRKSARNYEFLLAPWESLQIFLRLLRAQVAGNFYAPAGSLSMVVAAVIYFLSPFDLIPDSIPVLGLVDDASVLTFVARSNLTLISNFRKWEILSDKPCYFRE